MIDTHPRGPVPMETTMPDPTAIRLASEARRADLADELYSSVVEMHNLIDKAYQDERAALLVAIDLLAKAGADPGGATDACRFLGCSAADLLATVTSLYETRGGLVAEVADLRAKMSNLTGGADLTDDEIAAVWRRHTKLPAHCYFGKDDCAAAREFVNRGRAEERKAWQDATGCPTPDEARAKRERWTEVSRANLATIDDLRAKFAAVEVTAERDALDARVAALEAVVKAAASTLHVYVGEDFEVCRVCGIEDAKADHVDLDAYARGRDAADPVTVPAPDRAEELIIAQYDGCRKVAAELGHDGNWYAWGEWVKVHPRARHIQVESMRRALASLATPSPRYVAVRAEDVPPGTAPERVAWFGSITIASLTAKQLNSGGYKRSVMEWGGDPGDAAILDTHAEAPPVAPPRFIVVPRAEVNGRPASWFHTEAEAGRYVALCNDNPDLFGADDEIEGALESYTHAVVDTCATPPALPQVEAFELPAVEWTEEVGGGAERSVGARHRAVACGDGSWRLTIDGKTTSSAESKARVEDAVALLAGRAEVRR